VRKGGCASGTPKAAGDRSCVRAQQAASTQHASSKQQEPSKQACKQQAGLQAASRPSSSKQAIKQQAGHQAASRPARRSKGSSPPDLGAALREREKGGVGVGGVASGYRKVCVAWYRHRRHGVL
jgi:hypothetical protein